MRLHIAQNFPKRQAANLVSRSLEFLEVSDPARVPGCHNEVAVGEENGVVRMIKACFGTFGSKQTIDVYRRHKLVVLVHDENEAFQGRRNDMAVVQEASVADEPRIRSGKVLHCRGLIIELSRIFCIDIKVFESVIRAVAHNHLVSAWVPADAVRGVEFAVRSALTTDRVASVFAIEGVTATSDDGCQTPSGKLRRRGAPLGRGIGQGLTCGSHRCRIRPSYTHTPSPAERQTT